MNKIVNLYSHRIDHFKTFKVTRHVSYELLKCGKGGSKPRLFMQIKRAIVPKKSKKDLKKSIIKESYADIGLLVFFGVCATTGQIVYCKTKQLQEAMREVHEHQVEFESEESRSRKTNLRYQTLLYWYESACTTFLAAWAASLSWERKATQIKSSPRVLILPISAACLTLFAM